MTTSSTSRLNIDEPLWDQHTFVGRFRHFAFTTDPTTVFATDAKLLKAKELVESYRVGKEPKGTTREEIIYAKKLYTSAFHPDTGEMQNFVGRMSFQLPGGMLITGGMLSFYRSVPAVVFWQWINQSFNAFVNYTNRNANSELSVNQLGLSYVMATTSAMAAALGCKAYWTKTAGPFMQRYVPFAAVAAANCINIPMMRQQELISGIDCHDENGKVIGQSRIAAVKGISQVILSRIVMAAPGMLLLPVITSALEKRSPLLRKPWANSLFQTLAVGAILTTMVPSACAIYPQNCSIKMSTIQRFDGALYEEMRKKHSILPERVYFNKGL